MGGWRASCIKDVLSYIVGNKRIQYITGKHIFGRQLPIPQNTFIRKNDYEIVFLCEYEL